MSFNQAEIESKYKQAYEIYQNKQYEQAYKLFYELAKYDDISAQLSMAVMLINGEGVERNEKEGYNWYKIAADKGDDEAQYAYGSYAIKKNEINEGILYINKSFKQNNIDAIIDIALFKFKGEYGFKKDSKEAILLLEKVLLMEENNEASRFLLQVYFNEYGIVKTLFYFVKNFKRLNINVLEENKKMSV